MSSRSIAHAGSKSLMNLYDEFRALVESLDEAKAQYALCGGLAMAVHGKVRATIDIDMLVPPESLEIVTSVCRKCGFTIEAKAMTLAEGRIQMKRLTKAEVGYDDALSVDLLVVSHVVRDAWEQRQTLQWEGRSLVVASREGLISLKRLRGSGQDLDDIAWLEASRD